MSSIFAHVMGTLVADATEGTTAKGNLYARAFVRVGAGELAIFVGVMAFDSDAIDELVEARKGDDISAAGRLQIGIYEHRDGERRPSYTLFNARILTARRPKPKSKLAGARPMKAPGGDPFDEDAGRHDDLPG